MVMSFPKFCYTAWAKDYECNSNPKDEKAHGTHVAGLAGAETDNFNGIASIIVVIGALYGDQRVQEQYNQM